MQRPKQGEFPIVCRITYDRKKTEFQIPFLTCPLHCWDKASESALPSATMYLEINRQIQSFKAKAAEIQYEYSKAGKTLTLSVLKSYLLGKQKTHWNLLDYANQYIEKREKIEGERFRMAFIKRIPIYCTFCDLLDSQDLLNSGLHFESLWAFN